MPPPAFGPDASPPVAAPPPAAAVEPEPSDEDTTEEIDLPPSAEGPAASPPVAAPIEPPVPAASPAAPRAPASAPPAQDVPPPSFAPKASPAPAVGSGVPAPAVASPAVPPPSFAPAQPAVSPPPFGAAPHEEEEEVIREVRVRKLVDDGVPVEDREVGKVRVGPYVAMAATIVLAGVFGTVCGGQIDRAVRANRAIESAETLHTALIEDQNSLKNLKSRISGAARKALHKTQPGPDFELLDHLNAIKGQRPFAAKVWSHEFYQAFKCAPLLFEYYRQMNELWDVVGEVAGRNGDPTTRAVLKTWPDERNGFLELNATDGSSGWGIAFKRADGKIFAVLGTFKGSRQETVERETRWRSEFTPLGGGPEKTLNEYQPGFDPLNEAPEEWFVRVNPDLVLGPKRDLMNYGGPLVAEAQDPYLRYLVDVNALSKALSAVQSSQDLLIEAIAGIKQERRVFTFGF